MTDRFLDANGETRLSGTLVAPGGLLPGGGTTGQVLTKASNADGDADWETGGGYTPPTTREQVAGNNVSVANNATGVLTWDLLSSGTALLDLAVPAAPTIATAGVYAVTVQVSPGGNLTAAGSYDCTLELDQGGDDASINATSAAAKAGSLTPQVALGLTYYVPALGVIKASVVNRDGVNAVNFSLFGIVQRLS